MSCTTMVPGHITAADMYRLGFKDGFARKYGRKVNIQTLTDNEWLWYNHAYQDGKRERGAEERM